MSPTRRIILNTVAIYGRSLFALCCGLFGSRWVLMALGQEDFGLYGVVGGLVIFIGIINMLLQYSVARFYAVSVGAAEVAEDKSAAVEKCRAWFSTAVLIHTVIPLVLMLVGEPIGEYAIRQGWIAVPAERMETCLWVFRFACISSFIGMVSVPFSAMYTAKQYIAELTIYGFITSAANVCFFYYMASHPAVWLGKYAAWMACMSIAPTTIIAIRAHFIFPECRLYIHKMWNKKRVCQLFSFAGWLAFGVFGWYARTQGLAILLNRHTEFGPARNASMTVANQVGTQTETLASALMGSFEPAIVNAYGAKNFDQMRVLAFRASKFGSLLSAIFVLPLVLEVPTVLSIWLKDPPQYAAGFCWIILAMHLIERLSTGQFLAVSATGKVAFFQMIGGAALIFSLPLAWLFIHLGWNIYSVGWALLLTTFINSISRVWFARTIAGMSVRIWARTILVPLLSLFVVTLTLGYLPRFVMTAGICRVGVTTILCEAALAALAWKFALDLQERAFIVSRFNQIKRKLYGK